MAEDLMSLNDALGKMRDSVRAGDGAEMGPTLLSGLVAHIDAQREEIDRLRTALESIARHMSSEWPARCIENVMTARKALGVSDD
jgi:CHAD domain-containing protein